MGEGGRSRVVGLALAGIGIGGGGAATVAGEGSWYPLGVAGDCGVGAKRTCLPRSGGGGPSGEPAWLGMRGWRWWWPPRPLARPPKPFGDPRSCDIPVRVVGMRGRRTDGRTDERRRRRENGGVG